MQQHRVVTQLILCVVLICSGIFTAEASDGRSFLNTTNSENTYTITPSAGPNGSINPAAVQTVDYNGASAFTIVPEAGFLIQDVLVDGVSIGPVSGYTFENVSANHTIAATFVRKSPEISNVSAWVTSKGGVKFFIGNIIKLEAKERYNSPDLINGTARITSVSQGYDSGIKAMTFSDTIFYNWDTTDLNPASDYFVTFTLTDSKGQTATDNSLNLTLTPRPPVQNVLSRNIDISFPGRGLNTNVVRTYMLDSGFNSVLGYGWTHSHMRHIYEYPDGLVRVFNANGSGSFFSPKGGTDYESPRGDNRVLTKNSDATFQLKDKYGNSFTFNSSGKLSSSRDRNGNTITFTYDTKSQLQTIIDPLGQITTLFYDSNGKITSITDPAGRSVHYQYDADGNLSAFTDIGGNVTTYSYNQYHKLIGITSPAGIKAYFTNNAEEQLIYQSAEDGNNSLRYEYSSDTPEMTVTDALGNKTVYSYDNFGRVTSIKDPSGDLTHMVYDNNSKMIGYVDSNNNQTTYSYDANGNMLSQTDADGKKTSFTYDPVFNQITGITDANNNTTTFQYDAKGNLTSTSYPDGSKEQFSFDANGLLIAKTDRMSRTITYGYDSLGRLTKKTFPDGSQHTFTYDGFCNLLSATDAHGTTTYSYDICGRITQVIYPAGESVGYEYDASGRLIHLTYPDGQVLDYLLDSVNRLIGIKSAGQTLAAYSYDNNSRISRRDLQNGVYTDYSFDSDYNLITLQNLKPDAAVISSFTYSYDNAGNRVSMSASSDYEYVPASNRSAVNTTGGTVDYSTNTLNQYSSAGDETYLYDLNGNLTSMITSSGSKTYAYDYENHLVQVNTPTESISYSYDFMGRRISKTTSSGTTRYIHAGQRVIMEKDNTGNVKAKYVYGIGIDEILVMERSGVKYYYSQDGLVGSVSDMTDSAGNVVESFAYNTFGMPNHKYPSIKFLTFQ